jgi:cytochrome bd ubiquinol oxidase subunit II
MSSLVPFWYIVIAVLWTGFFILEGFDFGVGMLHAIIGTDEAGRRAAINTIGPLWDGNEVWLIVAGAGMFAAFPGWYATMFSAYNLALVLLLAALIVRGVAFEYRAKRDAASWRRTWDVALTTGSFLAPLLIGIALAGLLHGLPINSAQNFTGSFWDLLQPYALFTGVTLVLICLLHGATFLCLKTTDAMRERSWQVARRVAPVTGAAVIAFIIWTHVTAGTTFFLNVIELLAVLAVIAAVMLVYGHRDRRHHRLVHPGALRRPVPQRDGLLHQQGLQPHRAQHRLTRVLPQGDDRRRDHPPAGRARLPDLDLLRVPAAR